MSPVSGIVIGPDDVDSDNVSRSRSVAMADRTSLLLSILSIGDGYGFSSSACKHGIDQDVPSRSLRPTLPGSP